MSYYEAVEWLPDDSRPDMDNLMEWFGQVTYMETEYAEHKKVVD